MIVVSVLLLTIGKLSDIFGRVRLFNLGFLIFTLGSILLYLTPNTGDIGALELILFRIIQAVGGSFIMANSFALITDNFKESERGFAISINSLASVSGVSIGIVVGGVLSVIYWRDIFLLSVPLGIFGTAWSYLKLKETSPRKKQKIDVMGNVLMAAGLISLLIGVTYGITPYKQSPMGWTNPMVILALIIGTLLIVFFILWEGRIESPMLNIHLFRNRTLAIGSFTAFISAMGMMGLLYMLTLLFQGVWLPLHGYSFSITPLWAGIYMLPLTVSMGIFGIIAGRLADRSGAKWLVIFGLLLSGVSLFILSFLSYNFLYYKMMILLILFGLGYAFFNSPNIASVMSTVPPQERGSASGTLNNMRNTGYVTSMGIFFSILIAGISTTLPSAITSAINSAGASSLDKTVSNMPPTVAIFGSFLGINPIPSFIPNGINLPASTISIIEGNTWFSEVFSGPFMSSLDVVLFFASGITIIAALISILRKDRRYEDSLETIARTKKESENNSNKLDNHGKL